MASTSATRLAIEGGEPVRAQRIPAGPHGAAELGDEEIEALTEVIRRRTIFRFGVPDEESYVARLEAQFRAFTGRSYADEARRFSKALAAEGIANGTIYNQGVPDRHIYRHWDYVLNKWTSDRTGYPWARPYYQGEVEYSPDITAFIPNRRAGRE